MLGQLVHVLSLRMKQEMALGTRDESQDPRELTFLVTMRACLSDLTGDTSEGSYPLYSIISKSCHFS